MKHHQVNLLKSQISRSFCMNMGRFLILKTWHSAQSNRYKASFFLPPFKMPLIAIFYVHVHSFFGLIDNWRVSLSKDMLLLYFQLDSLFKDDHVMHQDRRRTFSCHESTFSALQMTCFCRDQISITCFK